MIVRAAFRLLCPIIKPPSNRLNHRTSLSYISPATAGNRAEEGVSSADGSAVYREARKYSRPSIVAWSQRLHNSVSFIGSVDYPAKQIATKNGRVGVHTCLRVKTLADSHASFRILLKMWDEMAERAMQHLKPNDYVYVSGQLGSYTTTALQGIEKVKYEVTVKELNYVNQGEPGENFQGVVKSESTSGESSLEKYRSRLHLWQVFFANPYEWYDQRKTKKKPKQPDFKHKNTGEALWLRASDPPWILKQLELLDSRHSEREPSDLACKSLSRWSSDGQINAKDRPNGLI